MASRRSSSLLSLPAEIILKILELTIPSLYSWAGRLECPPIADRLSPGLLNPSHISSAIRSMALAHRPLWRLIAQTAMLEYPLRRHTDSLGLLLLSAHHSCNTLDIVDLRGFEYATTCPQRLTSLLDIVARSTASIRQLYLPRVIDEVLLACDCQMCGLIGPDVTIINIWERQFRLMHEATSLSHLHLALSPSPNLPRSESFTYQTFDGHLKPTHFSVVFEQETTGETLPGGLRAWLSIVSTRVEHLTMNLEIDLDDGWEEQDFTFLVKVIPKAASSTLRTVSLAGEAWQIAIAGMMLADQPHLERLEVKLQQIPSTHETLSELERPLKTLQLSALMFLCIPAWTLRSFAAPLLQRVELQLKDPSDEVLVVAKLRDWHHLETLVMQATTRFPRRLSRAIQGILRSLTPSQKRAPSCPMLSCLAISGDLLNSSEQLLTTGRDYDIPTSEDVSDHEDDEVADDNTNEGAGEEPIAAGGDAQEGGQIFAPATDIDSGSETPFAITENEETTSEDGSDHEITRNFRGWDEDHNQGPWAHCLVLGFDLYHLDRKRQQFSAQSNHISPSSKCVPLTTIRLVDCLVDPMAWSLITESQELNGQKTCHPDPLKLQAQFDDVDPYDFLPRFLKTLYHLNARPRD